MENFSVFKNTDKKEGTNQPDYRVTEKNGDKFEVWGACWSKTDKNGKPYLSCSKNKPLPPKVENKSIDYPENNLGEPIL